MSGRQQPVLVVEDNAVNQKLLVRFLTAKGYRVVCAASTAEAEEALTRERPGLILMDVSLPGENGLAWVQRIRADGSFGVPVIAVTAHALPTERDRALAAGCADFITKPLDLKALLRAIETHFRSAH